MPNLNITVEDKVCVVEFNRPHAMNSIDPEMRQELYAFYDRMKNDDDIHAVEDRNQIYWSQLSAAAVGDNPSSSFARWADHVGDASVTTSLEHGSQGDLIDSSATAKPGWR